MLRSFGRGLRNLNFISVQSICGSQLAQINMKLLDDTDRQAIVFIAIKNYDCQYVLFYLNWYLLAGL